MTCDEAVKRSTCILGTFPGEETSIVRVAHDLLLQPPEGIIPFPIEQRHGDLEYAKHTVGRVLGARCTPL